MKVVILGCGRVGGMLATHLYKDRHQVTVIDISADAFRRRGQDFKGRKVVGNGCDYDVLQEAGVGEADVFISLTPGDNRNAMAAQIAKVKFKVPLVIARINDPLRAASYEEMGIVSLCQSIIVENLLHQMVLGTKAAEAYQKILAQAQAQVEAVAQEA
ncbi:MAG: NAD-binding protein [Armatimonadetes bacterium]|nr:NAD-binding protein [Armatimonadota bacterium]